MPRRGVIRSSKLKNYNCATRLGPASHHQPIALVASVTERNLDAGSSPLNGPVQNGVLGELPRVDPRPDPY